MKVNGLAYASVRTKAKHNQNERAIHIKVANTVNPHKNATPAHEYFHLVQYGMTYFRNAWYLEGMARWAQDSISKIKYPSGADIPAKLNNKLAANQIYQAKYKASSMLWYPLAVKMKDKATIPSNIVNKYKYVDGSAVFRDNVIYGANVMRNVLKTMKTKEEAAAAQFGGTKQWRNKGQRAEQNNSYIMDSVRDVYKSK